VGRLGSALKDACDRLDAVRDESDDHHGSVGQHAKFMRDRLIKAMDEVRSTADQLEQLVDDALWPLPKYREMLYVY